MHNNSDGSNLSEHSFNGSRMAEICRELSGEAKNRDLGSDSDCNRDIDYRYFIKILMERDRSPNSRESSCSRSQWAENSREHRRDQFRNRDRGRDDEWNLERGNFLPSYNYNAADRLNSFVDNNRRDLSMMPAYNDSSVSPWNNYPVDGMLMNQNNAMINQNSFPVSMPPNLEMAQTSTSSINQMSAPLNIDPVNQSNMAVKQNSSASPLLPDPMMTRTSNSRVNPKRTRWNNPMDDITMNQSNPTMIQSSALPVSSSLEMTETSNLSVNPCTSRVEIENYSQYGMKASEENNFSQPDKEIIRFSRSVLYPPGPHAPPPTRNKKPPGCKTIFVGGLPPKITEKIINEIFERCGAVESIKMSKLSQSKKCYCHVRFFHEMPVENALNFSGYRIKIENKEDPDYSSKIHVDYAQAKNDQRDYERKQRHLWQTGQFQPNADIATQNQNNMTINQGSSVVPMSSSLEMREISNAGVNSCAFMTGIGNSPLYRVIAPQKINFASPVKDVVIQFTRCVLYPPDPTEEPSPARMKPPGCKTIYVGGLPYEITKDILNNIFETCGAIQNIRLSRNNICHIQFCDELSVENALYFNGYTLKIDNKDDTLFSGKLHVHYSLVREDEREYELKCQNEEASRLIYSECEASRICEKLKSDETFSQAAYVLIRWLERGECKKKDASVFYSMIQCTQSQVKKLQDDKVKYEETLNQAKSLFKRLMDGNIQKFMEIEKIFNAACVQKCWDNFTKTQRKNIEMWKKQSEEIKNAHLEDVINEREDEEMELSEDENDADKKNDIGHVKSQYKEYIQKLQEEANSLRCQLEAAQKELKASQSDQEESKNKDSQLTAIRTALQNSMKEVLDLNQKYSKAEAELKELRGLKRTKEGEEAEGNDLSQDGDDAGVSSSINIDKSINTENDVRLVSLISSFLIVQPFGATVDYIWPFIHQIDSSINVSDVENLMKRFPTLFKEESIGTESNLEKKWKFIGFQASSTLS